MSTTHSILHLLSEHHSTKPKNSPADDLVNAVVQSQRDDLLVEILLADLVQYLQTTDDDEPVLRVDALGHARQDNAGQPLARLLQHNLAGDVAQRVEAQLVQIAPSGAHAKQDESQKAAALGEDGGVLGGEAEIAQDRGYLEDALAVGILGAEGPADAEELAVVVIELDRVLVLVLEAARRGGRAGGLVDEVGRGHRGQG